MTTTEDRNSRSRALPDKEAGASPDEAAVVRWLAAHPDFFESHPDVLAMMRLPSPHQGRAISFQDRQIEILRERQRVLERKLGEWVHIGRDNEAISQKLLHWVRGLLTAERIEHLPALLVDSMRTEFSVPLIALRLWRVDPERVVAGFREGVDAAQIQAADAMGLPYCGPPGDHDCCLWLPAGGRDARSVALIPLRRGIEPETFGLLVLGSGDPERFRSGIGTAFLERIAEIASAALGRLVETKPGP
jgi:uncharacterized protein YigA (DUF484 family)